MSFASAYPETRSESTFLPKRKRDSAIVAIQMRKLAREAVIFMLLGAVVALARDP